MATIRKPKFLSTDGVPATGIAATGKIIREAAE